MWPGFISWDVLLGDFETIFSGTLWVGRLLVRYKPHRSGLLASAKRFYLTAGPTSRVGPHQTAPDQAIKHVQLLVYICRHLNSVAELKMRRFSSIFWGSMVEIKLSLGTPISTDTPKLNGYCPGYLEMRNHQT